MRHWVSTRQIGDWCWIFVRNRFRRIFLHHTVRLHAADLSHRHTGWLPHTKRFSLESSRGRAVTVRGRAHCCRGWLRAGQLVELVGAIASPWWRAVLATSHATVQIARTHLVVQLVIGCEASSLHGCAAQRAVSIATSKKVE